MNKIIVYLLIFIFSIVLISPSVVLAGSPASNALNTVGSSGNAPYKAINPGTNDVAGIVGIVVQAFLGLLGVIFLVYMIYAGYNSMVARGYEEKVTKATETIQRAIIGLIITIGAYAISFWVFDRLLFNTGIIG